MAVAVADSKLRHYLAVAREESGITQERLAKCLRSTRRTVSRLENGHSPVTPEVALTVAELAKRNGNRLALQAGHEATGGMLPAWPDGDGMELHRLVWLLACKREDIEADQALARLEQLLSASTPDKERIGGCLLELLDEAFAALQLAAVAGEWAGLSLQQLCREANARQREAGVVR